MKFAVPVYHHGEIVEHISVHAETAEEAMAKAKQFCEETLGDFVDKDVVFGRPARPKSYRRPE